MKSNIKYLLFSIDDNVFIAYKYEESGKFGKFEFPSYQSVINVIKGIEESIEDNIKSKYIVYKIDKAINVKTDTNIKSKVKLTIN